MDELHLELPFAGSRMLRDLLNKEGIAIGRCHVATLMKRLRIEALYRKPNTSKPTPRHKIYPYLLRGLTIDRPNQVWAMDITYVPMARGFVSLAAIIDWFSRQVLSWRLSITMKADFCVEVLKEALARHGKPEIFNSDQGSQFTSHAFTSVLREAGVAISMDGRARGGTTSSSNGCGGRSNTRRSTCGPTTLSARRARQSAGTSLSKMSAGPIRVLTGARPTKPTSTSCCIPRRPEIGRKSTYPSPGCCSDKPSHLLGLCGATQEGSDKKTREAQNPIGASSDAKVELGASGTLIEYILRITKRRSSGQKQCSNNLYQKN